MSQAPSVAFIVSEGRLVGSGAIAPGNAPNLARVSPGDAASGCDAGAVSDTDRHKHCVSLKGTTRGLEILISGTPPTAALGARLTELLAEAPSFFAGCDARVAFDGALPSGALACLEDVATRFELRIVEISPLITRRRRPEIPRVLRPEDVRQVDLAEGTGPVVDDVIALPSFDPYSPDPDPAVLDAAVLDAAMPDAAMLDAATPDAAMPSADAVAIASIVGVGTATGAAAVPAEAAAAPGPRLVIGPVRSGMIVEHPGHLVVIGDVNPGAEVRAEGSIMVLGRLRGVAHAAIGRDGGFIVALSLQPQQLRIGRMVARAGDADCPGDGAEIAYATGETIVVERFWGRLPSGLAASM